MPLYDPITDTCLDVGLRCHERQSRVSRCCYKNVRHLLGQRPSVRVGGDGINVSMA
jgi:hypothetical protein